MRKPGTANISTSQRTATAVAASGPGDMSGPDRSRTYCGTFKRSSLAARDGYKEWNLLEFEHVRFGQSQGCRTIGTTGLTGAAKKEHRVQVGIDRAGRTMWYVPDVIYVPRWDSTKRVILEDKYQGQGGSCESKPFESLDLLRWALDHDPNVVAAYLVLEGDGWSDKAINRLEKRMDEGTGGVKVFFSEDDFLTHGIPELHAPAAPTWQVAPVMPIAPVLRAVA